MAWRFVRQPNGTLARFSDVVDNFTHINLTAQEAYTLALEYMSHSQAVAKVNKGKKDHIPWSTSIEGDGLSRWRDALKTIEFRHGYEEVHTIIIWDTEYLDRMFRKRLRGINRR